MYVGGFEPVFVIVCDVLNVDMGVVDFVIWGDLVFVELCVGVTERRGVEEGQRVTVGECVGNGDLEAEENVV